MRVFRQINSFFRRIALSARILSVIHWFKGLSTTFIFLVEHVCPAIQIKTVHTFLLQPLLATWESREKLRGKKNTDNPQDKTKNPTSETLQICGDEVVPNGWLCPKQMVLMSGNVLNALLEVVSETNTCAFPVKLILFYPCLPQTTQSLRGVPSRCRWALQVCPSPAASWIKTLGAATSSRSPLTSPAGSTRPVTTPCSYRVRLSHLLNPNHHLSMNLSVILVCKTENIATS